MMTLNILLHNFFGRKQVSKIDNMSEANFGRLSKNIYLEFGWVLQKIEVVNRLAVEAIHCVIEQSGFGQAII